MNAKLKLTAPFCALIVLSVLMSACGEAEPKSTGTPPAMRRLTNDQYRNIIADVFGPQITVAGQADPLLRTDGLLAVGARSARITPSGFEKFYGLARSIAQQVVSEENRAHLIPCQPALASGADEGCAQQFFTKVGRLLYRRPLLPGELDTAVKAASLAAQTTGDFYRGLSVALAGMMTTPQFLFVVDTTEPDPDDAGNIRLTAHAKAARLSFLLWNTTPHEALLSAADAGALHTKAGLAAQVDAMMASPRLDVGVRAFFDDFLRFDQFETLEKDSVIYPAFTVKVVEDAREQVLRTALDHLIDREQDYRDLFTTRKTFVSGALARIYRIPTTKPSGNAWVPYEFAAEDPRAGLLTQVGFAALASHPGRSSPTLRGRAIREALLCQKVPDPPGNVDFSLFEAADSNNKTARERLTAHRTAPACAGCHKLTDPIGLGLENLDGVGQLRTTENGAMIDASGDLDGIAFSDPVGLGQAMHDNPATTSCLVDRMASYAMGYSVGTRQGAFIEYLKTSFAKDGHRLPDLIRRIAISDALYAVSAPEAASRIETVAQQKETLP
jgi:hypothetical protein